MAKYDGLLGQPLLEIEEPDKEGGVTLIFKDNRFMFIKVEDGKSDCMAKFDGIRMADLVEVQDPDKDGGITLVFKENKFLHVKIVDGKIVTESIPE